MTHSSGVYSAALERYRYGKPLWVPEPAFGREVRIGDVGVVDETGQFQRFFNVTVGPDHPYNDRGVPPGFEVLHFDKRLISVNPRIVHPGAFPSNSVKYTKVETQASGQDPTTSTGGSVSYTFECTQKQGALLILLEPGKLSAVPASSIDFRSYMSRHHARWLEFVTQTLRLDYAPEDLIFVRGTVKTTPNAWAVGAYLEEGNSVHKVSVHMNAGSARLGFDLANQHVSGKRFDYRVGMGSCDPPSSDSSTTATSSSSTELPEVILERQESSMAANPFKQPANQCIFLQYFKLKPRRAVLGMFSKIVAGSGSDQLPPPEDPSLEPWIVADGGEYDVEAVPEQQHRSAVDNVLDYILRYSSADTAVASDADLLVALPDASQSSEVEDILEKSRPRIVVDDHGVGALAPSHSTLPAEDASQSSEVEDILEKSRPRIVVDNHGVGARSRSTPQAEPVVVGLQAITAPSAISTPNMCRYPASYESRSAGCYARCDPSHAPRRISDLLSCPDSDYITPHPSITSVAPVRHHNRPPPFSPENFAAFAISPAILTTTRVVDVPREYEAHLGWPSGGLSQDPALRDPMEHNISDVGRAKITYRTHIYTHQSDPAHNARVPFAGVLHRSTPQGEEHHVSVSEFANSRIQDHPIFQYSQSSGKKKVLSKAELSEANNDARRIQLVLYASFGYRPEGMKILMDDFADDEQKPTKRNILRAMQWLTRDADPNDSLFFHYAGHGVRVESCHDGEADGFEESIYPVDFEIAGHIIENEMYTIMARPLPPGCRSTAIFESCHSGSLLAEIDETSASGARHHASSNVARWSKSRRTNMLSSSTRSRLQVKDVTVSVDTRWAISISSRDKQQGYLQVLHVFRERPRTKALLKPSLSSSLEQRQWAIS